jgi:predicted kinase
VRGEASTRLILLMGLPGAGKSTLARALAQRTDWIWLDRDAIRAELFPADRGGKAEKRAANAEVWTSAREHLRQGRSVMVDGMTFARRAERQRGRKLARALQAECVEVFLHCPVRLAQQRVRRSRHHPARDRNAALVREVAKRFAPAPRRAIRLDARLPVRAQLRRLLAELENRG